MTFFLVYRQKTIEALFHHLEIKMDKVENINTWISQISQKAKFSMSVDCVIFGYDDASLKVLLIDCNMPPFKGKKSLIGDLLNADETATQAARRILEQRTQLQHLFLEHVNVYSDPNRHPLDRVVTYAYYSIIKISQYENQIFDAENKQLEWIDLNDITELAFDHLRILKDSFCKLQRAVREHPIGFSMLPKKFSLIQLQNFYETILKIKLDRRNFRRKLRSLDLLIDLNEFQNNVAHRPAKLYSFDNKKYLQKKKMDSFRFEI
jgi:8-oxo-dGTP diphosphatase